MKLVAVLDSIFLRFRVTVIKGEFSRKYLIFDNLYVCFSLNTSSNSSREGLKRGVLKNIQGVPF